MNILTHISYVHNNITHVYTSDISRQRTVYIYIQFVQRHAIHILRIKCNLKLWEQKCVNITGMSYFEKRWPIMQEKLSILRWYFNVFGPSDVLFLRERKKTVRSLRVDSNTRSLHWNEIISSFLLLRLFRCFLNIKLFLCEIPRLLGYCVVCKMWALLNLSAT